ADGDGPERGHGLALPVLRGDGGDPDPRQPPPAEPLGSLVAHGRRVVAARSLRSGRMVETIWSVIAVVSGLGMVVVILYCLITGRDDRDREEEARGFHHRPGPRR